MNAAQTLEPAPLIDETIRLLTDHYVFPETAAQVAEVLKRRLDEGAYDGATAEELAALVTADLQSVNQDKHLRLKHHAEPVSPEQGAAAMEAIRRDFETSLGGVPRLELLDGRVAVLEMAPMLFPLGWAAEPLSAALTLVSGAEALIIDLRGNRGGDPDTVAFVCSHLLDERTHLNTMHWRDDGRVEQSWTLPYVPGARFGGSKPVYVLTSGHTFSAAEELSYDLQQLGRGVIVGETTRGGAHPCDGWTVHPHLEVTVPTGRSVNPVSGTNWEGTGVRPDVACAADEALARAHELALARLGD
ncbi:C-terminal processing protease CtpA/Prc [Nocardioides luteus]|uniref:Interphotoreceptor retinoid-binding protein n=1 Tax=Nocardioides luteus TaxID=1844 RepID=A0ABQ5T5E7_9ACTN|nr:S41 family peptidase [Nocardioides luteus]MDR7308970.1 C-terminal processing protease CtpA/Prc [Nocardioides luteus]GGR71449.1 interphotoreceptor retinoid-binding protein [Nocardioides luteus]GLJ70724.1 interphotoreceptor retinoid-binding protein [Nocardioides luteus]